MEKIGNAVFVLANLSGSTEGEDDHFAEEVVNRFVVLELVDWENFYGLANEEHYQNFVDMFLEDNSRKNFYLGMKGGFYIFE